MDSKKTGSRFLLIGAEAPVIKAKAAPVRLSKAQVAQERAVRAVNAINGTQGAARTAAVAKATSALREYRALGGIVNYFRKAAPAVAKAAPDELHWPEDLALEVERHGRA